jgi:GNAT superfamily N-acetyltransferase
MDADDWKSIKSSLLHDLEGYRKLSPTGMINDIKCGGDMLRASLCISDMAFIVLEYQPSTSSMYIKNLYVKPSERRKGLGSILLKFAESYTISSFSTCTQIELFTVDSHNAESFYKKHGYDYRGEYRGTHGIGTYQAYWVKELNGGSNHGKTNSND